jgi:hypothetical protein
LLLSVGSTPSSRGVVGTKAEFGVAFAKLLGKLLAKTAELRVPTAQEKHSSGKQGRVRQQGMGMRVGAGGWEGGGWGVEGGVNGHCYILCTFWRGASSYSCYTLCTFWQGASSYSWTLLPRRSERSRIVLMPPFAAYEKPA